MADIAVFASGTGTNFTAIHRDLTSDSRHRISLLISDRKNSGAMKFASENGIPAEFISYSNRSRQDAEQEILKYLAGSEVRLIVLAGFMKLLSPLIINAYPDRIINIHPSLLPRHPGTRGIEQSWESGDDYLGISIHYVDEGMDTGRIILQQAFHRSEVTSLEEAEKHIHQLEHYWYPRTIRNLLDSHENENGD